MKLTFISPGKFPGILTALLIIGLCFGCQKEPLTENTNESGSAMLKSTKSNNYMVITKSESLPSDFASKLTTYGKIVSSIPEIGVVVMTPTTSNFEMKISKLTEVKAVVPDLVTKWIEPGNVFLASNPPSIGSDETYFSYLWGMDAINAPEAWNAGYTGEGAVVYILDSGIDAEHPDLAPNLNTTLCASFVPGEGWNIQPGVYFNHGSHVAGIIAAADNKSGVIGVAPHAQIVAVKVLSEYTGSGAFSWINQGIVYAANNGADVINMSLGAEFDKNGFYYDDNNVLQKVPAVVIQNIIVAQQRAVTYAFRKGVTIVVSAGNNGENADGNRSTIIVPADLQNVIAVSATAPDYWYGSLVNGLTPDFDIPASYTNYGKSLVSVAAPGGDFDAAPRPNYTLDMVLSASSQSYFFAAGTSMAAPHVAGVAALIIGKNGGNLSPLDVTKQLFKTADKVDGNGTSSYYGNGRVNAYRAISE
jgi:subtilisin family serine protease